MHIVLKCSCNFVDIDLKLFICSTGTLCFTIFTKFQIKPKLRVAQSKIRLSVPTTNGGGGDFF